MTVQEIGMAIIANVDQVVEEWEEAARRDSQLKERGTLWSGALADLFAAIADAALLRPESRQARLDLVWRAARHGQEWREEGLPQQLLVVEHHVMQRALARYVARFARDSRGHLEAITRVDVAINLCMRASLQGFRRPEREAEGEWPDAVEMLAWEWAPPAELP
jgi:hypothetical protein